MRILVDGPALSASVQIAMAISGPTFLLAGLYRLGTKDKSIK